MSRKQILGLLLVASAIALAALFWLRGDSAPALPPLDPGPAAAGPAPVESAPTTGETREKAGGGQRETLTVAAADPELDPEIRASLTGFKGRVVDHRHEVVAGCGVRIYRGAMDSILPTAADLAAGTYTPRYVAGETLTAADGTFLIDGVWPRAFYLLFAGIGTDAPSHRVLSQAPTPGEILDLGDIVLNDAATAIGRVVDESGDPVAGALVRGVDLPGQLIAFLPVERFVPDGAVLIREADSPVQVLEMPPWVKTAFEHLPIPSTTTDADGRFRLVGLVPGNNVIATTKTGLLSDLKPGITLKAGQEKDLGTIRLRAGEELTGRVVDTAGKPVAAAEVLAGGTVLMAPVDFAHRLSPTDAEGRFAAEGFPPGKVTVAARRSSSDPWVLAAPQSILGDVTVTLPAVWKIVAQVTGPSGAQVPEPRFRLVPGRGDDGIVVMAGLGLLPDVDLRERLRRLEDGRWEITEMPAGRYILMASSDSAAMATAQVDLTTADAQVSIALPECVHYLLRVVGPAGEPIRSATVYVQERGEGRVREMPFAVGHTDQEGRLTIRETSSNEIRVSAEHPRWGTAHGSTKQGAGELLLRMQQPGWIDGTLSEDGKPPPFGKYTIAAEWRPQSRGATEQVPILATPDLEGSFAMRALQPGRYNVAVINSIEAITSPGGVATMAQAMYMTSDMPRETVEVVAGQGAQVHLHTGIKVETGPTGHLFGLVQIDGRLASGYVMMAWTPKGRRTAKVDDAGRFDLGQVPVGQVHMNLIEGGESLLFGREGLWSQSVELKQGEEREFSIEVQTSAVEGAVMLADGTPVAGVMVQARGRSAPNKDGHSESSWWRSAQTDADGNFRFERVPAGLYDLDAESRSDASQRGRLKDVQAEAGRPAVGLRLLMEPAVVVSGRVDMTVFSGKPDWVYVSFYRVDPNAPQGQRSQVAGQGVQDDGTFTTNELDPGTYEARVYASVNEWQEYEVHGLIEVSAGGRRDLFLRPVPKQRPPQAGGRR